MICTSNLEEMITICARLHEEGIKFEASRVNGQWEITLT